MELAQHLDRSAMARVLSNSSAVMGRHPLRRKGGYFRLWTPIEYSDQILQVLVESPYPASFDSAVSELFIGLSSAGESPGVRSSTTSGGGCSCSSLLANRSNKCY